MENINILWADDEIDLLKPHVMFLEDKGFTVSTVNNGGAALDCIEANHFDLVFLDENMPGLSGLETLSMIKSKHPSLPVVMITKSEEESIMEEAIGSKISDYLIKPVNPKQILLSIKKNIDGRRLVSEKTTSDYQQEFRQIGMRLGDRMDAQEWIDIYKKLVYHELELEKSDDEGMHEILQMQKSEGNNHFADFIDENYFDWIQGTDDDSPLMSHNIVKERLLPVMEKEQQTPTYFIVIDNLRYDQWRVLRPLVQDYFKIEKDEVYFAILPTATQYARNAIFSGMLPSEMEQIHPQWWKNDEDEGGMNNFEKEFLDAQLKRHNVHVKTSYNKITNLKAGKKLADNMANLQHNDLNVIVYNFVDMLSHARTDMEVIKELADDEAAYRSLTLSWFEHSPLLDMMKQIANTGARVILTTDHGTVKVDDPVKVVGDKNTNSNLRYKQGRNLSYEARDVFEVIAPLDAKLPKANVSTRYIFAKGTKFFVYPNNYHHFANYFRNTFQHGGISLEEVLIPIVELKGK